MSGLFPTELDGWSAATAASNTLPGWGNVTTVATGETGEALRVVLIDTRPERRDLVRHLVAGTGLAGTDIAEAATAAEAVELLDGEDRDLVVVEIQMPVSLGLETIAALRGHSSGVRIVVCSFHCDPATKALALAQGADAYFDKPVSSISLKTALLELLSRPARPVTQPTRRRRRRE